MEPPDFSEHSLDKKLLYKPLRKALLPPVVHGQYVPHDAKATLVRMPSHLHRNHSFTLTQYASAKFSRALSSASLQVGQSPLRNHSAYSTFNLGGRSATLNQLPSLQALFEPPKTQPPSETNTNIHTPTHTNESVANSGRAKFADIMDRVRVGDDVPAEPTTLTNAREESSSNSEGFFVEVSANAAIALPTNTQPPPGSERPCLLASTCVVGAHGLQLTHVEPGHHVTLMSVDCCAHMRRGTRVIKHGRAGRPHTLELRLSENGRYLQWESKKKKADECVVRLEWVRDVKVGQGSKVFQRYPDPRVAALSLTLYYTRPQRYTHHPDKPVCAGSGLDTTLDMVFEDPNDMCVWLKGLQALVETAHNKLLMSAVAEGTVTQSVVLMLPMVTGYPSCDRIEDTRTGLSVAESWDNEHAADCAAEGKRHSLQRKETARTLYGSYLSVARARLSYKDTSASASVPAAPSPSSSTSPMHGSPLDVSPETPSPVPTTPAPAFDSLYGIPPTASVPPLTAQPSLPATASAASQVPPPLLSPSPSEPLPPVEGLDDGFGAQVRIRGSSEICDVSWLQQAVALLPRAAQTYPWTCAYRIGDSAAGFEHMLSGVSTAHRCAADAIAASGSTRAFGAFLARAAGMSVLLVKTTHGDVIGCCATSAWERHTGMYGSGESVVFRVDHARDEALELLQHVPELPPAELHEHVETHMGGAAMAQLHAYRWCGQKRCRRFQHTTHDGFGIGGAAEEPVVALVENDHPEHHEDGDGAWEPPERVPVVRDEGPAIFLTKDLQHGQSRACPTYDSPRLTLNTSFRVLMLELWVPLPQ